MGLAGLALLLALATAGAGVFLLQKDRRRDTGIAAVLTVLLLGGAVVAWVKRPSLAEIGTRAEAMLEQANKNGRAKAPMVPLAGDLVCVLDLKRSRITVSPATDRTMNWRADGCADGRNQFASGADGWFRVFVSGEGESATVATFDPASGTYRAERYLLDGDAMASLRAEEAKLPAAQCGGRPDAARQMGSSQLALKARLPDAPNERLVYACKAAGG